ncbi:MAG TPA: hypothetical protein VIQ60_10285 [Gemmatimonadaceae bacterium]
MPAAQSSRVLFPAPAAPAIPTTSPAATRSDTPTKTRATAEQPGTPALSDLCTPAIISTGAGVGSLRGSRRSEG